MTNPNPRGARGVLAQQVPSGWPVGSFDTYLEAQAAVDNLADQNFPVEKLTIVGVDLMRVENITGRLTWGKVLGGGALSGAWMGLFIGLIFALFAMPGTGWAIFFWSLIIGAIFGLIFAAIAYGFSGGQRDFASATSIVAGHYDVLCEPDSAERARDMIAAGRPVNAGRPGNTGTPAPAQQQAPQAPQTNAQPGTQPGTDLGNTNQPGNPQ